MADKHTLFRQIIQAYQENRLEQAITELAQDENLAALISGLCGVDVATGPDFTARVIDALNHYTSQHHVVVRQGSCFGCARKTGGTPQCQRACPFNAIHLNESTGEAVIDYLKCTGCGLCVDGCPDGVMTDIVEWLPIADMIRSGNSVIAAVAPAIAGQYGASLEQLRTAFRRMGFTDMVEVAFFADMLTLKEAYEFDHLVQHQNDFMITSCCCPIWIGMLKKIYHELVPHVSPSVSPMVAAGRVMKKLHPGVKVVFIGPCIAKKSEAKEPDITGSIDAVLTFTELADIFAAMKINPAAETPSPSYEYASTGGRLYARAGGVAEAVSAAVSRIFPGKTESLTTDKADGVPGCRALLEKARQGQIAATFVEGMGCVGGCVGGPRAVISREEGRTAVDQTAYASGIEIALDSDCMISILKRIGIENTTDFKDPRKIGIFERSF